LNVLLTHILQMPKGVDILNIFLDNLKDFTVLIFLLASMIHCRQLKLTRWQRKLSIGEWSMYILLSIALPLYAVLYLAFLLGA